MEEDKQLAAETQAMQVQALEVFTYCGFANFHYVLDIHGTLFYSEELTATDAATLFPKMMGNLYIKALEGFNPNTSEWEVI